MSLTGLTLVEVLCIVKLTHSSLDYPCTVRQVSYIVVDSVQLFRVYSGRIIPESITRIITVAGIFVMCTSALLCMVRGSKCTYCTDER